ncbi:MAG: hypothetical protein LUH21_04210 [Clostridiales bacterium]|nr:hypothetical protein [Clostridiales bacterium]
MRQPYESIEDKLTEVISNSSVAEIEDFLGYQISADILENLEEKIRQVLDQMPEEEMIKYELKYQIK